MKMRLFLAHNIKMQIAKPHHQTLLFRQARGTALNWSSRLNCWRGRISYENATLPCSQSRKYHEKTVGLGQGYKTRPWKSHRLAFLTPTFRLNPDWSLFGFTLNIFQYWHLAKSWEQKTSFRRQNSPQLLLILTFLNCKYIYKAS